MGQTWGLSPRIALWICMAIIRPMPTHGAVVWSPIVQQTRVIEKLEQIQRIAYLHATEAIKTRALEAIFGRTSLDIYIKEVDHLVSFSPEVDSGETR